MILPLLFKINFLVDFERAERSYIPEDIALHNDRCDNVKYYT
jgi:hypothetical protein